MVDKKTALGLLFDRPKEPVFKEKGKDGVVFEVQKNFISERFADVAVEVQNRFGGDGPRYTVNASKNIDVSKFTNGLPRDAPFSLWIPRHSKIAGQLINLFMSQRTIDDLISTAAYVRDRINPQLFSYALSVVTLHRKDTKGVDIPNYVETFPDKFVDPRAIRQAREDLNVINQGSRTPIVIPRDYTGNDLDPEHKLWYFREDLGINLHHWHWHLVFPFDGPDEVINKDRRGEIFYYMHQQVIARYKTERICNALSVVTLHRKDTKGVDIPNYVETFPDKFVDPRAIRQAREDLNVINQGSRTPIVIPRDYTGNDLDPEHKLWYFREDLGINLHHWHWHLVFPFDGPDEVINKDRRGEIFYYMHQQVIARYKTERICNNMQPVEPFNNFRAPIKEGYYSKLDTLVANRAWPGRPDGTVPKTLRRVVDDLNLDITEIERSRDNFIQAVNQGFVVTPRNERIPLDEVRGIDLLGNMMEASPKLSPNYNVYGNLHNQLHNLIGYSHDPDHRHLENFGVIGDSTTAMRDPVFYRVHTYVDDIFQLHKSKLNPYTAQQLTFPGIVVNSIQVQETTSQARPNVLNTFWQQSDVNLSRGMDFLPRGDVFVRFTHLQHIPFNYSFSVTNNSGAQRLGMARIFLGIRNGFNRQPMNFNDQRVMMMEMDKFPIQMRPGQNTINRRSSDSVVTIPYEQTFRNQDVGRPTGGAALAEFEICGCGWPDHMLIPRGSPGTGQKFDLYVMVSNYEEDRIDQDLVGACTQASAYCGIRDRKFPDRKAMGYPFDRNARAGVSNLQQFLTPNMRTAEVNIVFNDRVTPRN